MYLATELPPDVAVPGASNIGVWRTPCDELGCIKNIYSHKHCTFNKYKIKTSWFLWE
jgi:hypothetical protein